MEYKIEFHPAALKEFCELDGSKKQTDLFALNGTHSKAKNGSSGICGMAVLVSVEW